jgi:SagB-type dehydrogenase family enzyme
MKSLDSQEQPDNDRLGISIGAARTFEESAWIKNSPQPIQGEPPEAWTAINRKFYRRLPKVELSNDENTNASAHLSEIFSLRHSCRQFSSDPISLQTLAALLNAVARVQGDDSKPRRTYPSAGMRWSTEWYLAAINITDLETGVYHYDAFTHSLETLQTQNPWDTISRAFEMQEISCPSAVIILTSTFPRSWIKYGARGSRFAHMETGAAAMCFDLAATEANLGTVWVGGFIDSVICELLDLNWDMELEAPMLCLAVGHLP